MSALGYNQTYAAQQAMSALPPIATAKADIRNGSCLLYLLRARSGHRAAIPVQVSRNLRAIWAAGRLMLAINHALSFG
jgi:hypothetical protein